MKLYSLIIGYSEGTWTAVVKDQLSEISGLSLSLFWYWDQLFPDNLTVQILEFYLQMEAEPSTET